MVKQEVNVVTEAGGSGVSTPEEVESEQGRREEWNFNMCISRNVQRTVHQGQFLSTDRAQRVDL